MKKTVRLSENSLRKLVKKIVNENAHNEFTIANAIDPTRQFEHETDVQGFHHIHLGNGYELQVFYDNEIEIGLYDDTGDFVDGSSRTFGLEDAESAIAYGRSLIRKLSRV